MSSMNEEILRNELDRIRDTYSFRLGLMITQAFFRKPWQIPLLPFRFLKLNFDFIRRTRKPRNSSFNSYERDDKSLMLFVASEGGKAACDRAMQMAKDWLKKTGHHIVIISSNTGMIGFDEPNMTLYMLPDPKSKRVASKRDWNISCENVIYRAIHSNAPSSFVFDGPYPYRGILNAINSVSEMNKIWMTSERTEDSVLQRCSNFFDNILQRNYSRDSYTTRSSRNRNYSSLTNKVLVATSYGSHNTTELIPKNISRSLSKYNNVNLIGVNQKSSHDGETNNFSELWSDLTNKRKVSSLQGAVVSDNLELITQLHQNMVPTVCVLHEKTNTNVRHEIQKLALSGGLFVTSWKESNEIELYIDAILNSEWNLSITQNETPKANDLSSLLFN